MLVPSLRYIFMMWRTALMLCAAFPITSGMSDGADGCGRGFRVLGALKAHMLGLEHDGAQKVTQECFVRTHAEIVARARAVRSRTAAARISRPGYEVMPDCTARGIELALSVPAFKGGRAANPQARLLMLSRACARTLWNGHGAMRLLSNKDGAHP
jgi:hypothetical protein